MTAPDEPCVCGTEFGHDCLAGGHVNRAALHAIYWLAEDAKTVLDAGDTAEVRRTLDMIRDAVLRGTGGEKP